MHPELVSLKWSVCAKPERYGVLLIHPCASSRRNGAP